MMNKTHYCRPLGRSLLSLALAFGYVVAIQNTANAGTPNSLKQIRSELSAAVRLKSLPTETSPPTTEWTNLWITDFGAIATGGGNSACWDAAQASSVLPTCVYGDWSAKRTLVLTGDSQAWMWEPAFDKWGQASGWKVIVLTKSACQPWLDSQQEYVNGSAFPACRVFQSEVRMYINKTRPSVVVAEGSVPVIPNTSVPRVKTDVASFVSSIAASDARVLIVDPSTSFYAYDYTTHSTLTSPTCLSTHPQQAGICNGVSQKLLLNYFMNSVLNNSQLPGKSRLLKLNQLLCDAKCPMIVNGILVYIDGDHVSYDWAVHVSSALSEILAPDLKGLSHQ